MHVAHLISTSRHLPVLAHLPDVKTSPLIALDVMLGSCRKTLVLSNICATVTWFTALILACRYYKHRDRIMLVTTMGHGTTIDYSEMQYRCSIPLFNIQRSIFRTALPLDFSIHT